MYPVSDAFKTAIEQNSRKYYWTGTITDKNGKVYEFSNEDIVKGSGYITRQCCGSSEIELGTVYAGELGISLFLDIDRYTLEDAEIKLWFHLVLDDGSVESIPMGVFEVSEANRNIKTLELKAYDYMLRFDKTLKLNASSGTAYSFLLMACTECKVELAQTNTVVVGFPAQNRPAFTQLIGRIAIDEGAFGYDPLNERLTVMEVVKTFTVDANFPPSYDMTMVELNDKNAFCMVSDYTFVSAAEEINRGTLQHLAVNTEQFERVEKLEVTKC